jgi:hypothetical protein
MLYEKLESAMREMVDAWVERLGPMSWQRRGDLLVEAARPFGERFDDPDQARLASTGFITAVLERLPGSEAVSDPHQACLFRLSLHPAHRTEAERYLADNPELRELVERELGTEPEDPNAADA